MISKEQNSIDQMLHPSEPAWSCTLPHLLTPHPDEWLAGLLLRCDEINHWACRTTLTLLLSPGPEKFHRCWRTATPNLVVIQPSSLNLDSLAQFLALPTSALLATTYHTELTRLYRGSRLHPKLLNGAYSLRLCPQCLAETRILRRTLTLPSITHCPQHLVTLQVRCQCGAPLHLFHRQARPFTCSTCGLDWAELPRIEAVPLQVEQERKYLVWYAFFFSRGTSPIIQAAQHMVIGFSRERLPLGRLLTLLVQREQSPQDVLNYMDRMYPLFSWR
jgi:hypothetical protein